MTLTTEQVQVPPTTARHHRHDRELRSTWAPVRHRRRRTRAPSDVLAVSLLTVPDREAARVDASRTVAEHGGIAAMDEPRPVGFVP